jgi:hypothetical protein
MGSQITINDTLQITKEQGFPSELNLEKHLDNPFKAEDFKDKIFEFKDKEDIRIYQAPPVRNFLVENRNGKWIYWRLVHILEVNYDYENKITSGKFKIIYINSPEEMKEAFKLIDRRPDFNYFT